MGSAACANGLVRDGLLASMNFNANITKCRHNSTPQEKKKDECTLKSAFTKEIMSSNIKRLEGIETTTKAMLARMKAAVQAAHMC